LPDNLIDAYDTIDVGMTNRPDRHPGDHGLGASALFEENRKGGYSNAIIWVKYWLNGKEDLTAGVA
jgi:hypothetical protein